jgi:hypothetical protein
MWPEAPSVVSQEEAVHQQAGSLGEDGVSVRYLAAECHTGKVRGHSEFPSRLI